MGRGETLARNRYVRYYRLVETVDERGRFHTRAEYLGDDYTFEAPAQEARRAARDGLLAAVAGWFFYAAALLPHSLGSRTMYVSIPLVLTAVPLGLSCGILWEAFRGKMPLDVRMADRLGNRYPARALPVALLPLVSLTGEAVLLLQGGALMPGDGVLAFCAAALAACGMLLFRKRGALRCRALPKAEEAFVPEGVGEDAAKNAPGDAPVPDGKDGL